MRTTLLVATLVAAFVPLGFQSVSAQDAAAGPPDETARFEAASIKPNTSGSTSSGSRSTETGLQATNVSLQQLIRDAYQVQTFQIVGAPGWIATARYDVMARGGVRGARQFRPMLRNLLADRFGLVARRETREGDIFALVVDRPGRLGPKLVQSTADCQAANASCGTNTNNRTLVGTGTEIVQLAARVLPQYVLRPVVDKTGLTGRWDFELKWASDAARPATPGDDGPSIFAALQEQLGLKLQGARGPVEVVVVERVAEPTPD